MLRYFSIPNEMVCDIHFEKSRQKCASSYFQSHVFIYPQNVHVPFCPGIDNGTVRGVFE